MSERISASNHEWWAGLSTEERELWRQKVLEGMAQSPYPLGRTTHIRSRKKPIVKVRGVVIP